ncbi:hypothetical protein JCM3774_004990 [Rhodotorula dairenensis]
MLAPTKHLNLDEEVRLATSNAESERVAELANLYSLVLALDYLERAHVRDAVSSNDYHRACSRLLNQYQTIVHLTGMDCTAAAHRLKQGAPAPVHLAVPDSTDPHLESITTTTASSAAPTTSTTLSGTETAQSVAETTQNFITFMDALKLKLRAKDQLHPLLTDLMQSYARFSRSNEWQGRPKLLHWLIELNRMKGASDEISDEQARQASPPAAE